MVINLLIIFIILLFFLAAVLLISAMRFTRFIPEYPYIEPDEVDGDVLAEHLSEVIRCKTIAAEALTSIQREEFIKLHRVLLKQFPRVHTTLQVRTSQDLSLLYIWPGRNQKLPGVLLSGHYDVPPVEPTTMDQWKAAPFSGEVKEGFVWGRGAMQSKGQMIAILQSVENMLRKGCIPERTVYLSFGHDCLTGGKMGACRTAVYLKKAGVKLEVVLDEGDWIASDYFPGMTSPAALIGITERGHIRFDFNTRDTGKVENRVSVLSRAISRLADNPLPFNLQNIRESYRGLVGAIGYPHQVIFANTWLLGAVAKRILNKHPEAVSRSRTQFIPFRFDGFEEKARAEVDVYLMPGQAINVVSEHIRKAVRDERVVFQAQSDRAWEAPPMSSSESPAYQTIERAILEMYDGYPVTPVIQPWPGDARYYTAICKHVFRFTPLFIPVEENPEPGGVNERIRIRSLVKMTQFYMRLLQIWGVSNN